MIKKEFTKKIKIEQLRKETFKMYYYFKKLSHKKCNVNFSMFNILTGKILDEINLKNL